MDALEAKHERELEGLRVEMKEKIKKAKKSERAVVEAQAIQLEFDMKARHRDEIEEFEETGQLPIETGCESLTLFDAEASAEPSEQERAEQRKEKAKRKKDKRVQKEKEKEETKAQILASGGGVKTARDLEIETLERRLAQDALKVRDIPSDGHCLYRAIADQLQTLQISIDRSILLSKIEIRDHGQVDYRALRIVAAQHLRSHAIEFAPFLGIDPESDSASYEAYCGKVESDSLAEWGGQLEIRALVEALNVSVAIYSADSVSPLVMTPSSSLPSVGELKISYHRHLFTLGEHYNSNHLLEMLLTTCAMLCNTLK